MLLVENLYVEVNMYACIKREHAKCCFAPPVCPLTCWGSQRLFGINMNEALMFQEVRSECEHSKHSHETLFSSPQDGGPVQRVADAGGVLAPSWCALEGHWDDRWRGPLSSTQGSYLHPAAGLCLHSPQICVWEVRNSSLPSQLDHEITGAGFTFPVVVSNYDICCAWLTGAISFQCLRWTSSCDPKDIISNNSVLKWLELCYLFCCVVYLNIPNVSVNVNWKSLCVSCWSLVGGEICNKTKL